MSAHEPRGIGGERLAHGLCGVGSLCPGARRRCSHEDRPAARRCSAPAARSLWIATPKPALPPMRAPGTASIASQVQRGGGEEGRRFGQGRPGRPGRAAVGLPQCHSGCCFPSYERIAERAGRDSAPRCRTRSQARMATADAQDTVQKTRQVIIEMTGFYLWWGSQYGHQAN
jgi:hypothetical protein